MFLLFKCGVGSSKIYGTRLSDVEVEKQSIAKLFYNFSATTATRVTQTELANHKAERKQYILTFFFSQ